MSIFFFKNVYYKKKSLISPTFVRIHCFCQSLKLWFSSEEWAQKSCSAKPEHLNFHICLSMKIAPLSFVMTVAIHM